MEPLHVVEGPPNDGLEQDRRMRAVLVDMQLLMYGNVSRFDQNSGRQKPSGGHCPPGESRPLHTIWQQAYVLARPEDREDVIAQATDALIMARRRTEPVPKGETQEQFEERVIAECDGITAHEAAVHMRTGITSIVRVRRKFNRDPNDGRPLPDVPSVPELIARGMTATQIAAITGWSKQRVQYHVRKLAA